ncbi:MAG: 50S ribosomal protein L9 [Oligoflexia bacterium]|nr:50S ribosomal protein L9 [Oligoflexia bacterium]
MKVILKEHVKNLGNVGDIVAVTAGYARNYLIPKKFAVLADEANKKFVEDQKRRLLKKVNAQRDAAILLKQKIDGVVIEFAKRVGGNGKLFGTVSTTELTQELKNRDIEIERKWIHTDSPIKELGTFDIRVKIFADVEATFSAKVLMDPKQVEEIKNKTASKKKAKKEEEQNKAAITEQNTLIPSSEDDEMTASTSNSNESSPSAAPEKENKKIDQKKGKSKNKKSE